MGRNIASNNLVGGLRILGIRGFIAYQFNHPATLRSSANLSLDTSLVRVYRAGMQEPRAYNLHDKWYKVPK